jgi:hypothetical protein
MMTEDRVALHIAGRKGREFIMPPSQIPQLNGRDLKVAEVEGPGGVFHIAFAGARKDGDRGYFYEDSRGRFFFYAFWIIEPTKHWDVSFATKGPWTGGPFKTTPENEAIFKKNIEYFFKTRRITDPVLPGDGSYAEVPVNFSWGIAR